MSSIKIIPIPLDKESWDNVATIIVKSFHSYSTNILNIKKWSDKQEDKLKTAAENHQELESRVDASDAALRETKDGLEALAAELRAATAGQRRDAEALSSCLRQLLGLTDALSGQLLTALAGGGCGPAAVADTAGSGGGSAAVAAELGASGGEQEEDPEYPVLDGEDGRPGDALDEATATNAESAAAAVGAEQPLARADEEEEDILAGARWPELRQAEARLDSRLAELRDAVANWGLYRKAELHTQSAMQGTIGELQVASERTRERLLTWRELLKESSHVMDSLGTSLAATQGVVQELRATQVKKRDVDEAVSARAKQLEELHDQTECRMDGLTERVEAHAADVERLVRDTRRQMEERIDEHGLQVAQMVERNMNPVNAYLNTMHIKADVVRVELDTLNARVPKLATQIDEVAADLKLRDEAGRERSSGLSDRVDALVTSVTGLGEKGAAQHGELAESIDGLRQEFGKKLSTVGESITGAAVELESLRQVEVTALARNLSTLEQKVAKWVHAHPLPAKVSEARIYSLEARLAEETDARLNIEQQVGMKAGRLAHLHTPRIVGGEPPLLPHLPPQPWDGGSGGRSSLYDSYRQQTARHASVG